MEYMVIAIKIIFEVIIIIATLLMIVYNYRIARPCSQLIFKHIWISNLRCIGAGLIK